MDRWSDILLTLRTQRPNGDCHLKECMSTVITLESLTKEGEHHGGAERESGGAAAAGATAARLRAGGRDVAAGDALLVGVRGSGGSLTRRDWQAEKRALEVREQVEALLRTPEGVQQLRASYALPVMKQLVPAVRGAALELAVGRVRRI